MNDSENAKVSRAYAATPRDEPSAALDDAVLARASRAVERKPGARANARHWRQLFAVAATLVVTASLVTLMEEEKSQIAVLAPAARDTAFTPAAKIPTEAVQAAEVALPLIAPPLIAPRQDQGRSSGKPEVPARDQPGEPSSRGREQPGSTSLQPADAVKAAIPAPDRQAFPAARTAAVEDAMASAGAPAPAAAVARAESSLQPSSVAALTSASKPSAAGLAERRSTQVAESVARKLADPGSATKDESPEAWLARITELRKLGRVKEAEDSFSEFRKRYPDYAIPAASIAFPK